MDAFPHDLLRYEPTTGKMYWRKTISPRAMAGDEAGSFHKAHGYWIIGINGGRYRRSRLALLWKLGRWPCPTADHINRIRVDDRIENLREYSRSDQLRNKHYSNKSGYRGVYWNPPTHKWTVEIKAEGQNIYLGRYHSIQAAVAARHSAEAIYYPKGPVLLASYTQTEA